MPQPALLAIAHLEGKVFFWGMLVPEVVEVGVLRFGHFSQHLLFLARHLLHAGVEFVFGRVFNVRMAKQEPLLAGEPVFVCFFGSLGSDFLVAVAQRVVLRPGGQ